MVDTRHRPHGAGRKPRLLNVQIGIILTLLGAVLAAQAAPQELLPNATSRAVGCGLLMALVVIAARMVAIAAVVGLRAGTWGTPAWPSRYRRLCHLHTFAWLLALAAIYTVLGWPQIVRENWGLRHSILLDDLLIVLPFVASLLLNWRAFSRAEGDFPCASSGPARVSTRSMSLQARHLLAPALVPMLTVLGGQDLLERFAPGPATPAMQAAVAVPSLLLLVAGLPFALRYIWHTEPMPQGLLREQLGEVDLRLRVRPREILVWHTGRTICNALVVGAFPGCRYVLLSDVLLGRLSPTQVAAIYGHELGHVRHGHLRLRILALVLPVLFWYVLQAHHAEWMAVGPTLTAFGIASAWQSTALTLVAALLYVRYPFSWYCRALERQADLCGCAAVASAHRPRHGTNSPAEELYVAALAMLSPPTTGGRTARNGWFHPSLPDRVAFLRHMTSDTSARRGFESRMKRLAWLLTGLVGGLGLLAIAF